MQIRFFFTVDLRDPGARLITRVTGGCYSHCGVLFTNGEGMSDGMYFESRSKVYVEPRTGRRKSGLRGPRPFDAITEGWVADDMEHHICEVLPKRGGLPITEQEADQAFSYLAEKTHTIRYAHLQLLQNWIAQRLRVRIAFGVGDNQRWTCSETCARVLPGRLWPTYRIGEVTFNQITPDGDKMASIYSGTKRLCA